MSVLTELARFLVETGRTHARIQCDNEPAILTLTEELIKRFPGLSRLGAPAYSPETLGNVERMNQTGQNQLNTLLADLRLRYGVTEHELTIDHPLYTWMVKHTAFLLGRYLLHTDGQTAYERRWGKCYASALCQFGETDVQTVSTNYC